MIFYVKYKTASTLNVDYITIYTSYFFFPESFSDLVRIVFEAKQKETE